MYGSSTDRIVLGVILKYLLCCYEVEKANHPMTLFNYLSHTYWPNTRLPVPFILCYRTMLFLATLLLFLEQILLFLDKFYFTKYVIVYA